MTGLVHLAFTELDRMEALLIRRRALDPLDSALSFPVGELFPRIESALPVVVRRTVRDALRGVARTIVLVGDHTWESRWVPVEVEITLKKGLDVHAIRLPRSWGVVPEYLASRHIAVHAWSEATLQSLATLGAAPTHP
jgi:hypothetical protein